MKVFTGGRFAAAERARAFRSRIAGCARGALALVAEINYRMDRGRTQRDSANEQNHTVDGSFWVYLR